MNFKSSSFKYRFSLVFCGLLLGAGVGPAEVQGYQLPDTGQTKCYDNYGNVINCPALGMPFYGQDAQYKGAQPAYQNNIAGTVADLNTKLVWQQDGGNYGTWQYARAFCTQLNIQAFGGYTDWRLPGRRELISIVNYGRLDPAININFFPASAPSSYWSSTPFVPLNPYYVWVVDFASGIAYPAEGNVFSTIQHYVRCVHGSRLPEGAGYGQFVANFDGTITDIATGLIWESQRLASGHFGANATGSWQKALADCEKLTVAGKVDWRLPNIRELESLVDLIGNSQPAIDPVFLAGIYGASPYYWSSTTWERYPGVAWTVDFFQGVVNAGWGKNNILPYRCVRGGGVLH